MKLKKIFLSIFVISIVYATITIWASAIIDDKNIRDILDKSGGFCFLLSFIMIFLMAPLFSFKRLERELFKIAHNKGVKNLKNFEIYLLINHPNIFRHNMPDSNLRINSSVSRIDRLEQVYSYLKKVVEDLSEDDVYQINNDIRYSETNSNFTPRNPFDGI